MAALIKHVLSKQPLIIQTRNAHYRGDRKKKFWLNPIKPGKKVESVVTGIAARGFLRPLQDYSPPHDALERCEEICSRTLGPNVDDSTSISRDPQSRFTILNDCFKAFKHSVPNSLLYQITTVGALKNFYATPISTTTPLDKMRTMELPENLHVQHEPLRFHPETDNLFGGQTAFPESSTLVTGLRTRKKYKSYIIPDLYCKE
ncbi:39S ribosomal protein L50, mitochondrial [Homalodisca vitripennis]|uniref:39S ribosomal protein L50, mitochondrial n=1 Tax=Homalodisca vitripennis TaxID=197043 RepID=UPI001EEBA3A9|nr:39S ribosomal protein L50, mitochondrial [Homalodisca vitripennis]